MGFLDDVMGVLQKPQGVVVGGLTGLGNQIGKGIGFNVNQSGLQALGLQKDKDEEDEERAIQMFRDLDERGVDTSAFEHLRPRAQTMMSGIEEGWKGKISPGELYRQGQSVEKWDDDGNVLDKVLKPAFDIGVDPLMLAGGAIPKVAGVLNKGGKMAQGTAQGLQGMGTVGNLANAGIEGSRGAMAATKAGQLARRGYQGLLATGDPMSAIGAGALIGLGEKALTSPLAKAAASRLGRRGVTEGAEQLALPPGNAPVETGVPRNMPDPTESPFSDAQLSEAFKSGSGASRPDLTEPLSLPRGSGHAYNPGSQSPIEAGPVGTTGAEGLTGSILELLNKQPKAIANRGARAMPPVGGGNRPKVTEAELLEFLREEARRLRG